MADYSFFGGSLSNSTTPDATDYTLGLEFRVNSTTYLKGYRYWYTASLAGTWEFGLFEALNADDGVYMASTAASIVNLVAGWNEVLLATPIALVNSNYYKACVYFTVNNGYSGMPNYWSTGAGGSGITSGPVTASSNAASIASGQGSYGTGNPFIAYPNLSFNATDYGIDIIVADTLTPVDPQSAGGHNSDATADMGVF